MNFQPWLEIILVLFGLIFGSYLAVRVELATIKEQIKAQAATIKAQCSFGWPACIREKSVNGLMVRLRQIGLSFHNDPRQDSS